MRALTFAYSQLQLVSGATGASIIGMRARRPFSVIRMKRPRRKKIPGCLPPLFKTKADVFEPNAVGIETIATGSEYSNKLRNEVDYLTELRFLLADLVFRSLAISNVLDRTEHLPGKARRVSLQIALTVHDTNFAVGANDPMFCVYAHFALNGFGSFPKHELSILGMDRFPNCRQCNRTLLRVQSVDPVRLI